ncbi:ABC transporter ATP-binding protein [Candidatus Woesearchaeota archaeon]|nr:ABC transporter ATP-binding protein [Candidatus Neomarinimicrobiota bacterium]MBT7627839.1 ABC transporter ATP-binding protein [Candidatus Woesearchaeota archaeon]
MIEIENLSKEFSQPKNKNKILKVLDNISLNIKNGEFIAFFGPNGCGKTTLLNILSGIDKSTSGTILINKKKPEESKAGFVFQNYNESMLPWRTIEGNISLALEVQGIEGTKKQEIINHLLKKVGLFEHKDKFFYELSGGMKQLTAICRAFAYNPDLLLLDEPFSSLDYSTSRKMGLELLDIWKENKKTTLFISHDVDEAVFLADKVVVLSNRPAKIKGIVEVKLPRPRKLDVLSSKEFFETRNKILRLFEYEK